MVFVVLLLLQAGMADIPTLDTPIDRIQRFYAQHGVIVVTAQIIGVIAAIVFLMFAWAFAPGVNPGVEPAADRLRLAGALVALASVVTATPPLWLSLSSAPSDPMVHALTRAGDLTDAALFGVVGLFALELLRDTAIGWLKILSMVVAGLSVVRAVIGPFGISFLDAVAPLAFIVLIVAVSIECLRGRFGVAAEA
jgi:hypothetical protein